MNNKKHIILDWNGTLINDAWVFVDVLNIILAEQNLNPIDVDIYRDLFTFPIKEFYNKLGVDTSDVNFNNIEKHFIYEYNIRKYNASLYDNIPTVLSELCNRNISLSILSASNEIILNDLVSHYKIDSYFDNIVGVDNHRASGKINRGKELINQNNFSNEETLIVGDTYYDYEVANTLNVDCILVSSGHQSLSQLNRADAKIINNLNLLPDLMMHKNDDHR